LPETLMDDLLKAKVWEWIIDTIIIQT
jgi:hypothetical protein